MTVVSVRIREAGPADAPSIVDLIEPLTGRRRQDDVAGRLEALAEDPDQALFVATTDSGEVVGWVHAFVARRVQTPPFVEIGGLVVSPAHRRSGVGGALVRRVAAWAEGLGLCRLRVRSRTDRVEAASFFETLGFSSTKVQYIFDRGRSGAGASDT